jgi:hypothetical protein
MYCDYTVQSFPMTRGGPLDAIDFRDTLDEIFFKIRLEKQA